MYKQNNFFLKSFFKNEELKEKDFDDIWNQLSKKIQPYQKEIEKNIKKIGSFDIEDLSSINLKDIYSEYQSIWKQYRTVEGVNLKKLKEFFFILFSNLNEGVLSGIYDNPEQFDDFLKALIKKNNQIYLRRLFSDLLYYYPEDNHLLFKRLKKLYNNIDKKKKSNRLLIEANTEFKITEEQGPLIIAQNILDIKKNLSSEVLPKIWLKEKHLVSGGIGQSIVKELCYLAKEHIKEENKVILDRLFKYLSENGNIVRFSNPIPVVSVLLRPFEQKTPIQPIKKEITKFLDQYIGDPRFESEKWINMSLEKSIFLRWKIGETLDSFFALLDYTAKQDPNADRMWCYRKEFIEAYWKEDYIKNAWIVLGKKAYKNRLNFLKKDFKGYGTITKEVNPIHSVLLFQIGDLILSEWNYNGKVRLWDSSLNFPQFYETEYSREDLVKNSKKEFIHSSSEKYYWQKALSRYIEQYTYIPCPKYLQRQIDKFQ